MKVDFSNKGNRCKIVRLPRLRLQWGQVLLDRLNPNKASGPDDLSARVLKECSAEIAQSWPASSINPLSKQPYQTIGVKPMWLLYIIIIYKKGQHLSEHDILVESQHGFCSGRSCETLLVRFILDLHETLDIAHYRSHKQTDLIIMDFDKCHMISSSGS